MKLNKNQVSWDRYMFGGNRLKCLSRDGFKCVKCGMDNTKHKEKYGVSLAVDHIDGNGKSAVVKNNRLSNLQTMCFTCHGIKDAVRRILTVEDVKFIRANRDKYRQKDFVEMFKCSESNIRWILKGVTWTFVKVDTFCDKKKGVV